MSDVAFEFYGFWKIKVSLLSPFRCLYDFAYGFKPILFASIDFGTPHSKCCYIPDRKSFISERNQSTTRKNQGEEVYRGLRLAMFQKLNFPERLRLEKASIQIMSISCVRPSLEPGATARIISISCLRLSAEPRAGHASSASASSGWGDGTHHQHQLPQTFRRATGRARIISISFIWVERRHASSALVASDFPHRVTRHGTHHEHQLVRFLVDSGIISRIRGHGKPHQPQLVWFFWVEATANIICSSCVRPSMFPGGAHHQHQLVGFFGWQ